MEELGASAIVPIVHSIPVWLRLTENWIYTQVRHLPAAQYDVHVVCERVENAEQYALPQMHILGDRRHWQFWREQLPRKLGLRYHSHFLTKQCRSVGARLVHSHFGHIGWSDHRALRGLDAVHIVSFYGFDASRLPATDPVWHDRYRALFAGVDLVLCEGPAMRERLIGLGCSAEKARVHHLGVDPSQYAFVPRRWVPGSPLRVLMVGRFTEKKGFPDALAALARLRKDVAVEITIIGDAQSAPAELAEKGRILQTIARTGLTGVVRMLGFQSQHRLIEEAYRHHVFLSPSVVATDGDCEGGAPIALIVMAATGMPIVSTRHCDIPAIVLPGQTGLLAEEHDIDGLTAHLRALVSAPQDWEAMVTAGRKHIEESFDARRQGQVLGQIYRHSLATRT